MNTTATIADLRPFDLTAFARFVVDLAAYAADHGGRVRLYYTPVPQSLMYIDAGVGLVWLRAGLFGFDCEVSA